MNVGRGFTPAVDLRPTPKGLLFGEREDIAGCEGKGEERRRDDRKGEKVAGQDRE